MKLAVYNDNGKVSPLRSSLAVVAVVSLYKLAVSDLSIDV